MLYAVDGDGAVTPPQESGTTLPFDRRPLAATDVAFPVTIPAGQLLTFYLRVQTHDTMALDPLFWARADFDAKERSSRLLDGAYYGGLLGLVLYNLFLFFGTADRNYLAYVSLRAAAGRLPGSRRQVRVPVPVAATAGMGRVDRQRLGDGGGGGGAGVCRSIPRFACCDAAHAPGIPGS